MASHTAHHRTTRPLELLQVGEAGIARIADKVAALTALAGVYLLFGSVFYYAAKEKLFDQSGSMPAGLQKQFSGSLLDSIPGLNASWVLLGLLEAVVVVGLAVSLLRGEFLPSRGRPVLAVSIAVAMFTFAVLAFGEAMTGQNANVFNLFAYFAGSGVVLALIRLAPPYRKLPSQGTDDGATR